MRIAFGSGDQVQEDLEQLSLQDCNHQNLTKESLIFCSCPQVLRLLMPQVGLPALQVHGFLMLLTALPSLFPPTLQPPGHLRTPVNVPGPLVGTVASEMTLTKRGSII